MSDTPTTDTPAIPDADSLIAKHAAKLQAIYDQRTAGDHTFTGALASFVYDWATARPIALAARDNETAATAIERMAAEFRTVLHKIPEYTHGSLAWQLMNDIDTHAASLRGKP